MAKLGGHVTCIEGENPPDCYLVIDGDKIAVEVTQLSPLSFDDRGAAKNRTSEDAIPMRICDRMDRMFGAQIPDGLNLLLFVHGPLGNPRRFTRSIEAHVRNLMDGASLRDGYRDTWNCAGNSVEAMVVVRVSPTGKKVVGAVMNHDAVVWAEAEAIAGLCERLVQKEAIMAQIAWPGARWLVLLNAHPFLGPGEYCAAYGKVVVPHGFERVYFVHRDRTVYDMEVA